MTTAENKALLYKNITLIKNSLAIFLPKYPIMFSFSAILQLY